MSDERFFDESGYADHDMIVRESSPINVQSCKVCGAMVERFMFDKHVAWHEPGEWYEPRAESDREVELVKAQKSMLDPNNPPPGFRVENGFWVYEPPPGEASKFDDREAELIDQAGNALYPYVQPRQAQKASRRTIAKLRAAGVMVRLPLTEQELQETWETTSPSHGALREIAHLWGLLPNEEVQP